MFSASSFPKLGFLPFGQKNSWYSSAFGKKIGLVAIMLLSLSCCSLAVAAACGEQCDSSVLCTVKAATATPATSLPPSMQAIPKEEDALHDIMQQHDQNKQRRYSTQQRINTFVSGVTNRAEKDLELSTSDDADETNVDVIIADDVLADVKCTTPDAIQTAANIAAAATTAATAADSETKDGSDFWHQRGPKTARSLFSAPDAQQSEKKPILLRGPASGQVRQANQIHELKKHGFSDSQIFHKLYLPKNKRYSTEAYNPVEGAMGMNGVQISLNLIVGNSIVQLFLSTLQDTIIGTNDLYEFGYTPADSSTASLANVCSSTPCVATLNVTSAGLNGPYGLSGPVYQDRVILPFTDESLPGNTNLTVTDGQFVAASSKSGTNWAFGNSASLPPSSSNVGQFGVPVNGTACYGETCFDGIWQNFQDTYSLDNIIGVCSNYSVGSIVSLGGAETTLYSGSITYANIASSTSFNISVATGYEDAIVVTAITMDGTDMTGGDGQSAIGDYSIVEADSAFLLFQPNVYLRILATLVNAIDSTKSVTAATPNLVDIFLDEVSTNLTLTAYYALPPINLTVSLDGSTSRNIAIPPQAYMPIYQTWELPTVVNNYVVLINSTVNYQSITGNNTVLGLPLFYTNYTILDRTNERIGFAAPSDSCSIGCSSLSTQETCDINTLNCAWCFNPLTNSGICVETTLYGASSPTANSIYTCPTILAGIGNSATSLASSSFWTIVLAAIMSMYFLLAGN